MAGPTGPDKPFEGSPFDALGNLSKSQLLVLTQWVSLRQGDVGDISTFHRIRAQQLRKTAGILEKYYSSVYPGEAGSYNEALAPTFRKEKWQPDPIQGYASPAPVDDQLPMNTMSQIKNGMREMFQRREDAIYYLNQVRCLIEKHEDWAQYAYDFVSTPRVGA